MSGVVVERCKGGVVVRQETSNIRLTYEQAASLAKVLTAHAKVAA
jgi:hypothetical protein